MTRQLVIGTLLLGLTIVIHASCTGFALRLMREVRHRTWEFSHLLSGMVTTAGLALLMFFAGIAEATLYAITYVQTQAIPDFESALYFSIVTFTTLGYGDVTLEPGWRILASTEAANGIIMFGWTTALIVGYVNALAKVATRRGVGAGGKEAG